MSETLVLDTSTSYTLVLDMLQTWLSLVKDVREISLNLFRLLLESCCRHVRDLLKTWWRLSFVRDFFGSCKEILRVVSEIIRYLKYPARKKPPFAPVDYLAIFISDISNRYLISILRLAVSHSKWNIFDIMKHIYNHCSCCRK